MLLDITTKIFHTKIVEKMEVNFVVTACLGSSTLSKIDLNQLGRWRLLSRGENHNYCSTIIA